MVDHRVQEEGKTDLALSTAATISISKLGPADVGVIRLSSGQKDIAALALQIRSAANRPDALTFATAVQWRAVGVSFFRHFHFAVNALSSTNPLRSSCITRPLQFRTPCFRFLFAYSAGGRGNGNGPAAWKTGCGVKRQPAPLPSKALTSRCRPLKNSEP